MLQALELVGEPLDAADAKEVQQLIQAPASAKSAERLQRILDKHCLVGVHINPESRVKVQQGQAAPTLVEQGWRAFLVKVQNEAESRRCWPAIDSRNAGPLPNQPQGAVNMRWMDIHGCSISSR